MKLLTGLTTKKKKRSKKAKVSSFLVNKLRSNQFNHGTLLAVVLAFVVVGSFLIYQSFAANFNSNDEQVQYNGITSTRASVGRPKLAAAGCLNTVARNWSKTMATTVDPTTKTIGYFRHNPNFAGQILSTCGYHWSLVEEDIGVIGNSCTAPLTDNCSQSLYGAFVSAKEISDYNHGLDTHYGNIINPNINYVGVGAYRDNIGKLWITHDFMQCTNCPIATYTPVAWQLNGSTTSISPIAVRAVNVTAHAGQTVGYYNDISNLGPNTATYPRHVDNYHYSSSGALLSTSMVDIGTSTTAKGSIYSWVMNLTIPATAVKGEKYCHLIWYNYAFGPGTGSGYSNTSCVTVI